MSAVRVLASDPDLLAAVEDPARRRSAREELVATELMLKAGEQLDVRSITRSGGLGVLILSEYVVREISISDLVAVELMGPEDLLYTSRMVPGEELLPFSVRWSALVPARLALLDRDFSERVSRWPEVVCALLERARRPGDRAAFGYVTSRLPTVDARLLTSLWHWASSLVDGHLGWNPALGPAEPRAPRAAGRRAPSDRYGGRGPVARCGVRGATA